ncbi:hypothetical protein S245_070302, partial [Arachis hypogaea]
MGVILDGSRRLSNDKKEAMMSSYFGNMLSIPFGGKPINELVEKPLSVVAEEVDDLEVVSEYYQNRGCFNNEHWKELTYLYIQYDEFDNAATNIMNHSPEAWDHLQFKDVIVKVANVELYYKAVHFYLQEHPDLINDVLNVLALRFVDIMRK